MRTAIYVRVARATESQPRPIEQQLDYLRAHLVIGGEEPADEHIFRDEGRGGHTLDRPALNRLRDRVRLGEYERVLVTDLHRLSRDGALLYALIEEFESAGCRVEILDHPYDRTHTHVMSLTDPFLALHGAASRRRQAT
jgi:site-specific DNA recombinase